MLTVNDPTFQTPATLRPSAQTDARHRSIDHSTSPATTKARGGDQDQATTYIGRDHYLTQEDEIDEATARAFDPAKTCSHLSVGKAVVDLWKGFDIPPRAARQSLLSSYLDFCDPWTPVLEQSDLVQLSRADHRPRSMLLVQALWLAGSRVTSAPSVVAFASSDQFYQRAKALFWSGVETDPILAIKASLMLQWYNPNGPEHVSYDNSEFWLKIGVGLGHQIGLFREPQAGPSTRIRRRLWWSLVARDNLISVAHGRPRAINLDDCDVKPPNRSDFMGSNSDIAFNLFSRWVEICQILGTIAECCLRRHMSRSKRLCVVSSLYQWLKTLPPELRVAPYNQNLEQYIPSTSNFTARQLHLPYLTSLIILSRSFQTDNSVSATATLAASFAARIFEDFLARDELKVLAPIFTRYCLISSLALVALMPHSQLWKAAQLDLQVLQQGLQELSKRWRSAIGASKALTSIIEQRKRRLTDSTALLHLDDDELGRRFEGVDLSYCRMWSCVHNISVSGFSPGQGDLLVQHSESGANIVVPEHGPMLDHSVVLDFNMMELGHMQDWILNDGYLLDT